MPPRAAPACSPPRLYPRLVQHQSPFGGASVWVLGGARGSCISHNTQLAELRRWPGASLVRAPLLHAAEAFQGCTEGPAPRLGSGLLPGAAGGGAGAQVPWAGAAELRTGAQAEGHHSKSSPGKLPGPLPPRAGVQPADVEASPRRGGHPAKCLEGLDFWGCVSLGPALPCRVPPSLFLLFLSASAGLSKGGDSPLRQGRGPGAGLGALVAGGPQRVLRADHPCETPGQCVGVKGAHSDLLRVLLPPGSARRYGSWRLSALRSPGHMV